MTEFLIRLWKHDPLLVISIGSIILLLIYIEILRLRIQMINTVFNAFGEAINGVHHEEDGGGCVTTLLVMALIPPILFLLYLILTSQV